MQDKTLYDLACVRLDSAKECLAAGQLLLEHEQFKSASNRAYYAVFHAMRAVLAFDQIDRSKHSGIISEFRRRYIKEGVFDIKYSDTISSLYDSRQKSDYNDFYVISKDETRLQLQEAVEFVQEVDAYVHSKKI